MFGLSATIGYAIQALCFLGANGGDPVRIKVLAQKAGVAKPYLSKIFHHLAQSGLVHSKRGYRGGVWLSRPPDQISLMDVVEALEGEALHLHCPLGLVNCRYDGSCPMHEFWLREWAKIEAKLRGITVADMTEYVTGLPVTSSCEGRAE